MREGFFSPINQSSYKLCIYSIKSDRILIHRTITFDKYTGCIKKQTLFVMFVWLYYECNTFLIDYCFFEKYHLYTSNIFANAARTISTRRLFFILVIELNDSNSILWNCSYYKRRTLFIYIAELIVLKIIIIRIYNKILFLIKIEYFCYFMRYPI